VDLPPLQFLVAFDALPWQSNAPGQRLKTASLGGQRLRLMELTDRFVEATPCRAAHAGWVVEGSFSLEHRGELHPLKAGEAFLIPPDIAHRAVLAPGERALLLLFEREP
jgi:hypothetical protein